MSGWGWWRGTLLRMLGWALALGFVTMIVCVSISPLSDWTQEFGACRGAEKIERDVQAGGDVTSRGAAGGNRTTQVSTTVFTLQCTYEDGEVELVGNDEAVLQGFAVGFALGAIPGALLGLIARIRGRFRDRERPPALAG